MTLKVLTCTLAFLLGSIAAIESWADGLAYGKTGAVPPEAAAAIQSLQKHLSGIDGLRFHAQLTEETVFSDSHKIQFEGSLDVTIKKPSSFAADLRSDYHNRSYRLHDEIFTVFDEDVNVFAQASAGGTYSEALGRIALVYGADIPMSDLLSGQAYELLVEQASRVVYIGVGNVDDHRCHHIAGSVQDVDWQIWIRSEGDPWLCKYIITDRNQPMAPQFVLRFHDWEVVNEIAKKDFQFVAPEGAEQIEFIRASAGEAQ